MRVYLSSFGWLIWVRMGRGFQVGFNFTVKLALGKKNLASRRPWSLGDKLFFPWDHFWKWRNFHTYLKLGPFGNPTFPMSQMHQDLNPTFRNLIFKKKFLLTSIRKVVCRGPLPFSNVRFLRQKPRGLKLGLQLC